MNTKLTTATILLAAALAGTHTGFVPASATVRPTPQASDQVAAPGAPNPDPANITKASSLDACLTKQAASPNDQDPNGQEKIICVFPTANPTQQDPGGTLVKTADGLPADWVNIQWAVNNVAKGGTVRLMQQNKKGKPAPFIFEDAGLYGHITFDRDETTAGTLTIQGEVTSREADNRGVLVGTTVEGGQQTFLVGQVTDADNKPDVIKPSVIINDIRFVGASPGPIKFIAGQDVNAVTGCSIVDYKNGSSVPLYVPSINDKVSVDGAFPIIVDSPDGPDKLTGIFTVANNYIGAPEEQTNLFSVMHISTASLTLTITNNKIVDAYWIALAVFGNTGETIITHNEIIKEHSYNHPAPPYNIAEGAAIAVGTVSPAYFRPDAYDGKTIIKDNTITVSSYNSSGIVLLLYPPSQHPGAPSGLTYEVSHNIITIKKDLVENKDNEHAAMACIGACANTTWAYNTVRGTGQYGILVTRTIPTFAQPLVGSDGPHNNHFHNNSLAFYPHEKIPVTIPAPLRGFFLAKAAQLYVGEFARENTFTYNAFGPVRDTALAGAVVKGDDNNLIHSVFYGDYPGKEFGTKLPARMAAILFPSGSHNNEVSNLTVWKCNHACMLKKYPEPVLFTLGMPCFQIIDENVRVRAGQQNTPKCGP